MDEEKLELNDQITKLKEKVELLVKEKEKLESELKTKSLSNEGAHLVRYYKFHENFRVLHRISRRSWPKVVEFENKAMLQVANVPPLICLRLVLSTLCQSCHNRSVSELFEKPYNKCDISVKLVTSLKI